MQSSPSGAASGSDATPPVDRIWKAGKDLVNGQLDQRSSALAEQVSQISATIRDIGSELQKRGRGAYVTDWANTAAGYVDRVGTYLKEADGESLAQDFEGLVKRSPAIASTLALVAGFAASRVIRVATMSRSSS